MTVMKDPPETTLLKFIHAFLLLAGLEILFGPYATLAVAQLDPTRVLIGRWEGRIEEHFPGPQERTLIIGSVKPTETGWVAQSVFGIGTEVGVNAYRRPIDVSLKDGLIVLEWLTPQKDRFRFVLTEDKKLEGEMYYAQYRGSGIGMRTLHLTLVNKASEARRAATNKEITDAKAKGEVWVNLLGSVYHKEGKFYGKTKRGQFMSEDDARKAGCREAKTEQVDSTVAQRAEPILFSPYQSLILLN